MAVHTCYVGVGANLGDPEAQIRSAYSHLLRAPCIAELRASSLYASKPMGPQDQPDYVNAVFGFETSLAPLPLLDLLQHIENEHQRVRKERWGARTLDLDLLFYNTDKIENERLQVPHPGIVEREFVVVPLAEIAPSWVLPNGHQAQVYAEQIDTRALVKIGSI